MLHNIQDNQPIAYLSMREAAAYRGIDYETFRYHINRKQGPRVAATQGARALFLIADLDAWVMVDNRMKNDG